MYEPAGAGTLGCSDQGGGAADVHPLEINPGADGSHLGRQMNHCLLALDRSLHVVGRCDIASNL